MKEKTKIKRALLKRVQSVVVEGYPEWPVVLGLPSNAAFTKKIKPKTIHEFFLKDNDKNSEQFTKESAWLFEKRSCFDKLHNPILTDNPRCAFKLKCKGTLATRMCYNCVKFDYTKTGFYCDECFNKRHPPHRMIHSWVPIADISDHNKEWIRLLARSNLEQDMEELRLLQEETTECREQAIQLGKELNHEDDINQAMNVLHSVENTLKNLMDDIKDQLNKFLSREDAVKRIQDAWKLRKARKDVRMMIRKIYQQFKDSNTGNYYYYNKQTKETTWKKPLLLGNEELEFSKIKKNPCKIILHSNELSIQEAAIYIQKAYRSRKALKKLRELVRSFYVKILDPNTQKYYYHNLRTNQVSWIKPKLLGSEDCFSPRINNTEKQRSKLLPNYSLTKEEAAHKIQKIFRTHQSHNYFRQLITCSYEKIWHDSTQKYYYHNIKTDQVSWIRPRFVDDNELLSPRSRILKLQEEEKQKKKQKKKQKHPLFPNEAAIILQNLFRQRKAKKDLYQKICFTYQKIKDKNSGNFFYYNKKTGETSWKKPKLLGSNELISNELIILQKNKIKKPKNYEEASQWIQSCYRSYKARKRLRSILKSLYEKHLDPATGMYFYVNVRTKETSWTKPLILRDEDIFTPRGRRQVALALLHTERPKKKIDSKDTAARRIQGLFQCKQAKLKMKLQTMKIYRKILDKESNQYFFFNTFTRETTWEKPYFLGDLDLLIQDR